MNTSRRLVAVGVVALLALQFAWHGLLLPPEVAPRWLIVGLFCLPLLPSLVLLLAGRPSAQFWAGVAALFYFCQGVTELWTTPQARLLAVFAIALSVGVIVSGSWDGMKARFSKRAGSPPNV